MVQVFILREHLFVMSSTFITSKTALIINYADDMAPQRQWCSCISNHLFSMYTHKCIFLCYRRRLFRRLYSELFTSTSSRRSGEAVVPLSSTLCHMLSTCCLPAVSLWHPHLSFSLFLTSLSAFHTCMCTHTCSVSVSLSQSPQLLFFPLLFSFTMKLSLAVIHALSVFICCALFSYMWNGLLYSCCGY